MVVILLKGLKMPFFGNLQKHVLLWMFVYDKSSTWRFTQNPPLLDLSSRSYKLDSYLKKFWFWKKCIFGPRVYPLGSIVIALVRLSVCPSIVLYCEAGRIAGFQFYRFTGIERHSFARPFLIHDYAMNRGTQSSDRGIVSNLGDPLWYLPDGVVNLEEKCFSARDMTCWC